MATKKERKPSSIDNSKVIFALLSMVKSPLQDRSYSLDDLLAKANVKTADRGALSSKMRSWFDPALVVRTKNEETGAYEERANKVLRDKTSFHNFVRSYLTQTIGKPPLETHVNDTASAIYDKIAPLGTQLFSESKRGFGTAGPEMVDLLDDLLGDYFADDEVGDTDEM